MSIYLVINPFGSNTIYVTRLAVLQCAPEHPRLPVPG